MSSTSRDVAKFIATVSAHFPKPIKTSGDPKTAEQAEALWTTTIVGFLAPFPPDILDKAALHILETRTRKGEDKWFPEPAELIRVCKLMQRNAAFKATPLLSHGAKDQGEWSAARIELANEMIQTETGREAARKGWIGALWDFARKFARLPQPNELGDVKAVAKGLDDDLDRLERGEIDCPQAKALLRLGRNVQAKRAVLAAKIDGLDHEKPKPVAGRAAAAGGSR